MASCFVFSNVHYAVTTRTERIRKKERRKKERKKERRKERRERIRGRKKREKRERKTVTDLGRRK